jgi:hypothetical protein
LKNKSVEKFKRINLKIPLFFSEKIIPKKEVAVRSEEEIEDYQKTIGYRKARMKRYGISSSKRISDKHKVMLRFLI